VYFGDDDIKHFIQISFPLPNRHNLSTVATEALGNVPTSLQATLFFISSRKLYLQSEDFALQRSAVLAGYCMGIIYKTLFLILIIYFTAARNKI
jgi:hypothetical protein